jgi:hypothetical protein
MYGHRQPKSTTLTESSCGSFDGKNSLGFGDCGWCMEKNCTEISRNLSADEVACVVEMNVWLSAEASETFA